MDHPDYQLVKAALNDDILFGLLLLADETVAAIEQYIYQSDIYLVYGPDMAGPIAVCALYRNNETELEIKNIAVAENRQGEGIGRWMLLAIRKIALAGGYHRIIVGTPDTAVAQLHFYESNAFKKYAVKKNFYTEHYPEPIIDNGTRLTDMQMLEMLL